MPRRKKGGNKPGKSNSIDEIMASQRDLSVRVKTAKGRRLSSTNWLKRQLNDPFVQAARKMGYRSRAAFKLMEMDDKLEFLKPGKRVLDLGAAPGGWTQIAVERVKPPKDLENENSAILGIDLQEMEPIPGAYLVQMDFMDDDAPDRIKAMLGGPVDVVLSDMAASSSGHKKTDHLKIMALCEAAIMFAEEVLAEDGVFLAKVLQGGTENELLANLKRNFRKVGHLKPKASRADSSEMYVFALGFRGGTAD